MFGFALVGFFPIGRTASTTWWLLGTCCDCNDTPVTLPVGFNLGRDVG